MSRKDATQLFRGYRADALDKAAAKEIAANIRRLDAETEMGMLDRHGPRASVRQAERLSG